MHYRDFQRDGETNDSDTENHRYIHTEVEREQRRHAK